LRLLISLFSPPSEPSPGLTRCLAVARAATALGHEVAFCSAEPTAGLLRPSWRVYTMPGSTRFGLPAAVAHRIERPLRNLSLPVRPGRSVGSTWMLMAACGMARPGYLRRLVQAQLQAVQEFGPDRIFTDGDPGAGLTASIAGISFSATYTDVLCVGRGSLPWRLMRRAMNSVLRRHGQPAGTPDELCAGPHVLKIIATVPELDGTDPARPDVCYVGHLLADQAEAPTASEAGRGRRCVLCHLGTGPLAIEPLRQALPLVFPADGERDCFVAVPHSKRIERIGNVHFLPHVPVEAMLGQCDWSICDGDQDTIVQSLRHDVPLLLFPGAAFARRHNARMVRRAGAGLLGEANDFTAEWLAAALAQHEERAASAAELGASIRSCGGPAAAVAAIEAWL